MDGGADARSPRRHDEQDGRGCEQCMLGSREEGVTGREPHNHFLDEICRQRRTQRKAKRRRLIPAGATTVACALLVRTAMAQSCVPLADSTACSAFNASSISTNSNLTGLFPFLSDVTDVASFDSGIQDYVANGYARTK